MLYNYIKIALRNLLLHRLYSFLNITGLAIGLAAGILVLLWATDEWHYNDFHAKLPTIHLLLANQPQDGRVVTTQSMPSLLAESVVAEIPEIERAARTTGNGQHLLQLGEKSTYENGFYTDPDFFNIFTFEAVAGDPVAALRDARSMVLTERTARKFFGTENPVGKVLKYNNLYDLTVGAVVRDVPANSTLKFDVLLPFGLSGTVSRSWDNYGWPTWVALRADADLAALNRKLENFIQTKDAEQTAQVFAYPFSEWRLKSRFRNGRQSGGLIDVLLMMGLVGGFVLLIACINFMNLATARSERRAREVGVRKVMGAQRKLIIGQFLSEALVMTFFAMGLGLLFAKMALPAFNRLDHKNLVLDGSNPQIWGLLLALGLVTGLLAGSYPAFFLSGFQPVRVLKGWVAPLRGGGAWLRKGLVTFQFVISVFLIIGTTVILLQADHFQNRPLGYDATYLIDLPARGDMSQKYGILKNELLQIPGVESVSAGTDNLVRFSGAVTGMDWTGKTGEQDFPIAVTQVGYDWVKTAGLTLLEGRDFSAEFGGDTLSCLLNETAVRRMGLNNPIGTKIGENAVVGVLKDFVFNSLESERQPLCVFLGKGQMTHFFVRFRNDAQWRQSLAQMEQVVKKVNPNHPFEFQFTRDVYQKTFEDIEKTGKMMSAFGGLAIFISCLGLFGLSAFVAERRKKEMGVRKVLGATVADVWKALSKGRCC